jgi:hypothetical protein
MESEELKYYLQCSRIRSLRNKKRMQREDFDKSLIRIFKEQNDVSKKIGSLGYEDLVPPVQRGWKRYFVMRKDVARSDDAKFFQSILDKINTTEYSWKKDFKVKRRRFGRKIYVIREQQLKRLLPYDFEEKKFSEREKKYFDLMLVHEPYGKQLVWIYVFTEPWRFELKIQPNIITKTRIKDFNLERRASEIRNYLNRNFLQPRLQKIMRGNYKWRWKYNGDFEKYKSPFYNRSFADILNEYMPEPQPMQLTKNPRTRRVSFCTSFKIKKHPGERALTVILARNAPRIYQLSSELCYPA